MILRCTVEDAADLAIRSCNQITRTYSAASTRTGARLTYRAAGSPRRSPSEEVMLRKPRRDRPRRTAADSGGKRRRKDRTRRRGEASLHFLSVQSTQSTIPRGASDSVFWLAVGTSTPRRRDDDNNVVVAVVTIDRDFAGRDRRESSFSLSFFFARASARRSRRRRDRRGDSARSDEQVREYFFSTCDRPSYASATAASRGLSVSHCRAFYRAICQPR